MERGEKLTSNLTNIFRFFLISIVFLNISGIIIISMIIPPENAKTYDLTLNYGLIFVSVFGIIISSNLSGTVVYDRNEKKVITNTLLKKIIINRSEILRIERVLPSRCRIVYKKNNSEKSILFIPKLFGFSPFLNYAKEIEELINK